MKRKITIMIEDDATDEQTVEVVLGAIRKGEPPEEECIGDNTSGFGLKLKK